MGARTDLATALASVPSTVTGTTVVAFDAGSVKLPAVVIVNGSPMVELETLGGRIGWALEAHCYVPAFNSEAGLDLIESLALAVANAGIAGGFHFQGISRPEITRYADQDVLAATVDFVHHLQAR